MRGLIVLGAALALANCSKPAENEANGTGTQAQETAAADAPPASFAQCAACHVVKKGAPHGLGPNLFGVYGTKAGELAGYNFSPAMKASGLTWDDATLDAYLANPRTAVPGTKMTFPGMADAAKRAEVIAWLKKSV